MMKKLLTGIQVVKCVGLSPDRNAEINALLLKKALTLEIRGWYILSWGTRGSTTTIESTFLSSFILLNHGPFYFASCYLVSALFQVKLVSLPMH